MTQSTADPPNTNTQPPEPKRSEHSVRTEVSRTVFVIMPFSKTPLRTAADLNAFFENNIKATIEKNASFTHRYTVARSADTFGISEEIIRNLYRADVVICDLSGHDGNPNVMFELGIRLAVSSKPTILIREANEGNRQIFDVQGYYTHPYSPLRYHELESFLVERLAKYDSGREAFRSPVLEVLGREPRIVFLLQKHRVRQRLKVLLWALMEFTRDLSIDAMRFLQAQKVPGCAALSQTPDLVKFFADHQGRIAKLPWLKSSIQPANIPALNAALVESPVAGTLPEEYELLFVLVLFEFHHLATSIRHTSRLKLPDAIPILLHDSMTIETMIHAVIELSLTESESQPFLKVLRSCYDNLYLKEWIERSFEGKTLEEVAAAHWKP